MTRCLIVNDQPDCAGTGYQWMQALRAQGVDAHSVANGVNVYQYPQDWLFEDGHDLTDFDVYLLTNSTPECVRLLGFEPKRAAVLFHGSDIRYGLTKCLLKKSGLEYVQDRGWPVLVSSLDLEWLVPGSRWLPVLVGPVPQASPSDEYVAVHAPSHRKNKGTSSFLEAAHKAHVSTVIVEGVPNHRALQAKARAAVFFDQLRWGYGVNAVEAFKIGVPVISGSFVPAINDYIRSRIQVPYWEAGDVDGIAAGLEAMRDPTVRKRFIGFGNDYYRRHHDPAKVGAWLKDFLCSLAS